jgi:cytochrome c oxidase subunit 4
MSEYVVPVRIYFGVFAALIALTLLTTAIAFFDLGLFNPVVALTIAIIKATLVVLFFMHARYSPHLIWIVGGAALFWLGILFVLTLSDYLTRAWAYY